MRTHALLLLSIALAVAIRGGLETNANSAYAADEEAAVKELRQSQDLLVSMRAIMTGQRAHALEIQDPKDRELALEFQRVNARLEPDKVVEIMSNIERDIVTAAAKYKRAQAERLDTKRWHYVPAGCLAVVGAILLVVPIRRGEASKG